jgi:hypothetical protein
LIPDILECKCVKYRGKGWTDFVAMGLK